jgi:mRNA interferase MazF
VRAGEIHVVDFGEPAIRGYEQAGTRPALVVHSEAFLRIPNLALVCPLTTRDRRVPNHVPVAADEQTRLRSNCFVMTEQVRAVDRRFVLGRVGVAPVPVVEQVLVILRDRLLAVAER